jgi:hypothetical protein
LSLVATNSSIAEKRIASGNRTFFSSRSEQISRAICFTDSADGRNGGAFQYSQPLIVRDRLEALIQKSGDQLEKAILSEVAAGLRVRVTAEGRAWMDRGNGDSGEQKG